MWRTIFEKRGVLVLAWAAGVGLAGLRTYPVPSDNVLLEMIALRAPHVFQVLMYAYATLWFTTPLILGALTTSIIGIVVFRHGVTPRQQALPPYPSPETRPTPSLVLGETHFATAPGRAPAPTWLTIPQRGLYCGVMIVGATGTGKTSACMYPYIDQLLRWRADDRDRKIGGLVMDVKGDFGPQVRTMLERAGRGSDYLEVGIGAPFCYNPLHNDLDPYAVAYAIASLLNNLYGRSKEPFWQQAYTDVMRSAITMRRLTEGYTTLADVYRYILDDSQIDRDVRRLKTALAEPPEVLTVPSDRYHLHCAKAPWRWWFEETEDERSHPYDAELESYLAARDVPYRVQRTKSESWTDRRHQVEAIERWYLQSWMKLDPRLRSNIVEGIVVFLSLFDSNPAVYRAFCPPRSAYTTDAKPGEPRPLPPIDDVFEAGEVVALNFPVVTNPALARAISVMLKLDGHRAVLTRIPRITANPGRVWRDVLFVCDEYHQLASVGETDPTGDERALSMSRQARLIPIVAFPSFSSLRSALHGDESWRSLAQCFRTKLFLTTSDEFTARAAAELCGRRDRLMPRYSLTEAGQGAHISLLSGRATAQKHTLIAGKSYAFQPDFIFPPRTFTELQNAQAIALPYDGLNPGQPQYCYLKPHYLDPNIDYFTHVAGGAL